MRPPALIRFLLLSLLAVPCMGPVAIAQIPAPVTTGEPAYRANGMTDQPFSIEVIDARRTVSNSLMIRLALTNRGTAPMHINYDFAGNTNPSENQSISAIYAVDPNGGRKYLVLRQGPGNAALCSRVTTDLKPGERRELFAQMEAPPDTTSAFELFFPKATPILNVPIGLPQAGEPLPAQASIGNAGGVPAPAVAVQPGPSSAIDSAGSNNEPDVHTNQIDPVAGSASMKAAGTVESANATVPFTVEVVSLKAGGNGARTILKLALTNGGSGDLDASGQFTASVSDLGDPRQISGVYMIDPGTQQRYEVVRQSQTVALCSKVDPALAPGERRMLEAQFPSIPATVKTVSVYFPHAAPISNVAVTR